MRYNVYLQTITYARKIFTNHEKNCTKNVHIIFLHLAPHIRVSGSSNKSNRENEIFAISVQIINDQIISRFAEVIFSSNGKAQHSSSFIYQLCAN